MMSQMISHVEMDLDFGRARMRIVSNRVSLALLILYKRFRSRIGGIHIYIVIQFVISAVN